MYQLVSEFQTLVVGVIGFSGVVISLLVNAWLSRRQHVRAVHHEMDTLRTALIAELELIQRSFREKSTLNDSNEDPTSAFYPESTPKPVYENYIGKIGLLSAHEVSAIIEAYTLINEESARLQLLSSGHHDSFNKPGYIFIQAEHEKTASGVYGSFLPKIEKALDVLRSSK